ncbi:MAG: YcxB family protein [Chitinophagaceae bacterium]
MTSSFFTYNKQKVIQALRYHFITRREIKTMIILVNVFAILSAGLFFYKKISPLAFLVSSVLWFTLMIAFWFILPYSIYKKAATFKDGFKVTFEEQHLFLENDRGSKSWPWTAFSSFIESPHFFHLYFDSRSFFLIPKESFESDEVHEARKFLANKISKKINVF